MGRMTRKELHAMEDHPKIYWPDRADTMLFLCAREIKASWEENAKLKEQLANSRPKIKLEARGIAMRFDKPITEGEEINESY